MKTAVALLALIALGAASTACSSQRDTRRAGQVNQASPSKQGSQLLSERERRRQSMAATTHLQAMYQGAAVYFSQQAANRAGRLRPPTFPETASAPPRKIWYRTVCKDDQPTFFEPTQYTFEAPTWQALNFAVTEPFYYHYEFVSKGKGANAHFTARAIGDLDCDGVYATFEIVGSVNEKGEVVGGDGFSYRNELE